MNRSLQFVANFALGLALATGTHKAFAAPPTVSMGPAGLVYTPDDMGNRIIDFSYAGYMGGGVAIPTLPVKVALSPIAGDNTATIQNAINAVSALAADSHGFRGAVLLKPGTYEVDGSLTISASGVVLRGSGTTNTTLTFPGAPRSVVSISGSSGLTGTGSTFNITDTYVPVGASTLTLSSVSGLAVGNLILIHRPWTQAWIDAMAMTPYWTTKTGPGFGRAITAINGNTITLDTPMPTPIESQYLTGTVQKATDSGRIQQCGVEDLHLLATFTTPSTADNPVHWTNCKNCWGRNIIVDSFGNGLNVDSGSRLVTVQDCSYQNGFNNGSARPFAFDCNGEYVLFQRCTGVSGFAHIVATQDSTPGPNVFLQVNALAVNNFDGGPHQRWAFSVLMDNVGGQISTLKIYNAGSEGTGHGWVAGHSICYNCSPVTITVQQPTLAYNYNYIMGGTGTVNNVTTPGTYVNTGTILTPKSLTSNNSANVSVASPSRTSASPASRAPSKSSTSTPASLPSSAADPPPTAPPSSRTPSAPSPPTNGNSSTSAPASSKSKTSPAEKPSPSRALVPAPSSSNPPTPTLPPCNGPSKTSPAPPAKSSTAPADSPSTPPAPPPALNSTRPFTPAAPTSNSESSLSNNMSSFPAGTTMKHILSIITTLLLVTPSLATPPSIAMGPTGIVYTPDELGNRITDFSYAGYQAGGVALPILPVRATVSPIAGDNTANIQNAINTVAARTPDANGLRGALLLAPGTYQLSGSLTISASGVVLRGSSQNNTILQFVGTNRTGVTVSGTSGSNGTGSATNITDTYVPLNATSCSVASTSGLAVGSTILIRRPWTQPWIDAMQMNSTFLGTEFWSPKTGPAFERTITAINGAQITFDIPLPTPIEQQYGPGTVQRYTETGRIQLSGVENLTLLDNFTANTGPLGLSLANCKNCWARNITVDSFGNGLSMDSGAKWCTIQDCIYQNGFNNGSARPSSFNIAGTMCLFQRCTGLSGFEHIVTTQDSTAGPNVFLQINVVASGSFDGGPHQKWALGILMDNFTGPVSALKIYNAGTEGTGHGWVAGYSIEYNCTTSSRTCQQPPVANHYNWIIGGSGTVNSVTNPGTYQNQNTIVTPQSLYLEQLRERRGSVALQNIGVPRFQGLFELLNVGSALAAGASSTADAAPITQNTFTATPANEWQFVDLGAGFFEIKNVASGKALALQGAGPGALLIQSTYANSPTMQWSVKDLSGTTCEIINRASGLALDAPNTTAGAQLDQAPYTGSANQQFQILPLQ